MRNVASAEINAIASAYADYVTIPVRGMALASREGYEGTSSGEAAEWLRAKAKGLDQSVKARMQRAREMGYITDLDSVIGDDNGLGRGRTAETVPNQRGRDRSGIVFQEAARDRNIRGQGRSQKNDPQTFCHGTVDEISAFELNHPYQKDMGWLGGIRFNRCNDGQHQNRKWRKQRNACNGVYESQPLCGQKNTCLS